MGHSAYHGKGTYGGAHRVVRRAPAFTLVELVIAVALTALLMSALIGVVRSVDMQLDFAREREDAAWRSDVARVLHRDLLFASRMNAADGWVWMQGTFPSYSSSSPVVRRVGYTCVDGIRAGESILIRLADGRGEPLAVGPTRLMIERLDSFNVPQPLSDQLVPTPGRIRVSIWAAASDEPVYRRDMVLH